MSNTRHITANVAPGAVASDGVRARIKTQAGRRYIITLGGDFGTGALNVQHQTRNAANVAEYTTYTDDQGNVTGAFAAAGGAVFMATGEYIFFEVTGATDPAIDLKYSSVQHGA